MYWRTSFLLSSVSFSLMMITINLETLFQIFSAFYVSGSDSVFSRRLWFLSVPFSHKRPDEIELSYSQFHLRGRTSLNWSPGWQELQQCFLRPTTSALKRNLADYGAILCSFLLYFKQLMFFLGSKCCNYKLQQSLSVQSRACGFRGVSLAALHWVSLVCGASPCQDGPQLLAVSQLGFWPDQIK